MDAVQIRMLHTIQFYEKLVELALAEQRRTGVSIMEQLVAFGLMTRQGMGFLNDPAARAALSVIIDNYPHEPGSPTDPTLREVYKYLEEHEGHMKMQGTGAFVHPTKKDQMN